ncbi:hypothetical protein DND132_1778 [Pseudodesulfovibrio mercurii]|uniref:Transmembrane protein n=1 Tax=Pseudodesulfovibrio mercurii TaxID=641491 RepID=F0JFY8_9BACT|nr:hypothetical protein [Pseudodesulfovibrio mercurii]EGB14984.1 hypothetical protein DND132_1778 [Pseudodesulfovibrio mercurii]
MAGDRISPLEVAVDALRLMRLRGRVYLGGALGVLAAGAPSIYLSGSVDPAQPFNGLTLTVWLLSLLAGAAVYVVVLHDSLSALRERPGLLPDHFLGRYLRFLGRGFLLMFMVMGAGMLCGVVMVAAVVILWPAPEGAEPSFAMTLLTVAAVMLPLAFFSVRWWPVLPATVMGDESSFRLSWRMTRGHSLRMLLFTLPFLLLNGAMQVVNGPAVEARTFDPFSPANLGFMVAGTAVMWFTFAAFIIWYEKLRLRAAGTPTDAQQQTAGEE